MTDSVLGPVRVHFAECRKMPFDKWARYRQNVAPRDKRTYRGDVAQLGEHHVRNVGVEGSNPFISTTENQAGTRNGTCFCFHPPCPSRIIAARWFFRDIVGYVSKSVSFGIIHCLYLVGIWNSSQMIPVPCSSGAPSSRFDSLDTAANSPSTSSSVGMTRRISAAGSGLSVCA